MSGLPGSVRYALRQFRLSPVFTAAAVLTPALAVVSLGACAFVAAIIPAGRAAAVSPTKALRAE